jgi:hypothetical protein
MKRNLILTIHSSLPASFHAAQGRLLQFIYFNIVFSKSLFGGRAAILALAVSITAGMAALRLFFPGASLLGIWGYPALMIITTAYLAYMIMMIMHLPRSCDGVLKRVNNISIDRQEMN